MDEGYLPFCITIFPCSFKQACNFILADLLDVYNMYFLITIKTGNTLTIKKSKVDSFYFCAH